MTSGRRAFPYPVVLMAFNRPDYLAPVLTSLAEQTLQVDHAGVIVHLDGYPDSTDESRGHPDRTAEVAALIDVSLPGALVVRSRANLGIAHAYESAEVAAFDRPDADWVVFLEDDMVLAPRYLETVLSVIERAESFPDVATVSASGDSYVPKVRGPGTYYPMHFAWAFALRRAHWLRSRPYLSAYLDAVGVGRYSDRDHDAVFAALAPLGVLPVWSAQDAVKEAIRRRLGAVALTTGAAYGTYIGEVGELFTPELFDARGLGSQELADQDEPWAVPITPAILEQVREEAEVSFAQRAARNLVVGRTAERRRIERLLERVSRLEQRVQRLPQRRGFGRT